MSSVFLKNNRKRSRSPSSEANNSFVKNVTSRVSGLLPATIAKWFSSPSSSENGSAPVADISDSSSDDEAPDNPVITQPAKRIKLSLQGSKFSKYTPQEPATLNRTENPELQGHNLLYNTIQSPGGRSNFIREPNYASTPYISPADVSNIEVVNVESPERDLTYKSPHIVSTKGRSLASKRKSLFEVSPKVEEEEPPSCFEKSCAVTTSNTSRDICQPSYRPALFGSPFYPGRTMYGGASSSIYINQPNIEKQKVAHVKESPKDNSAAMSSSAKRVMDLLENYSSPLMEAKRIPVFRNPKRPLESDDSFSSPSKSFSYKTQELHVSSPAAVLRLKQRSRLMDTTKAARQIIASHSSTLSGFQPYIVDNDRHDSNKKTEKESTGKLKTRLTRVNRGDDQFDSPEPVQLPTAVLQIDKNNLPKFTISSPTPPTSNSATPVQSPCVPKYKPPFGGASTSHSLGVPTTSTVSKATVAELPARCSIFTFASPVPISHDSQFNTSSPKFTFGSPERNVDKPKTVDDRNTSQACSFSSKIDKDEKTAIKSSAKSSKEWRCPVCMIVNGVEAAKCAACGEKQPSDVGQAKSVEKCTVCKFASRISGADKCLNCHKASTQGNNSIPLPIPQPADPSKWKCEGCWVTNEEQAVTCAACGSRGPKLGNVSEASKCPATPTRPVGDAPEGKQWECYDCWIVNKLNVAKCAACGSKSPMKENAESAPQPEFHSPFNKQPDEKLAEIARAQKAKWECSSCLVRNDNSNTECSCCGTEREGHSKETTPKPFNFPKESNMTFKFGIDPIEQKSNLAKKAETVFKMESTRNLEEPETNNNNILNFTFTPPGKKDDVKLDSILPINAPKMEFRFGVPKPATVNESSPVASTASVTTHATPVTAKPQEEPKLNNKPQEVAKLFRDKFFTSTPKTQQESSTKASPFILNNEINISPLDSPFSSSGVSTEKLNNLTYTVGGYSGVGSSALSVVLSPATTSGFSFGSSQLTSPQLSTSQLSSPQLTTSQLTSPQLTTSQLTSSQLSTSQLTSPQLATSQLSSPQLTISQLSSPQLTTSQLTSPQLTTSQLSSPQPTTPQQSAPQPTEPQQTAPQLTAPQQTAPQQAAPQQTAPQQAAPQQIAPQQTALQQNVLQQNALLQNATQQNAPQQSASTTTEAPTATLFQNPKLSVSLPITMFGTSQQAATLAPAPAPAPATATAPAPAPAPRPAAPLFNFGSNTQSAAPAPEKPNFNFSFGNNTSNTESPFGSGFKPAFGSTNNSGSNAFSLPTAAPPPNSMGNAEMSAPMGGGNEIGNEGMSSGIQGFSAPPQESMWSANGAATTNVFGASTAVDQKPAPFTFGAPNPFNSSATPSSAQPSLFGNQPAQNLFGMMSPNSNNNSSSSQPAQLFASPAQPAQPSTLFGAQPAAGMFGGPSQTPTFGVPSQSPAFGVPTQASTFVAQPATAFEAPSMTPQPTPNFSFGAQSSTGVFGFGAQQQQQQQQPQQQQQMYSFGANTMSNSTMTGMNRGLEGFNPGIGGGMMNQPMGMQFNVGSAPASNMRRMRKAVRRNQR